MRATVDDWYLYGMIIRIHTLSGSDPYFPIPMRARRQGLPPHPQAAAAPAGGSVPRNPTVCTGPNPPVWGVCTIYLSCLDKRMCHVSVYPSIYYIPPNTFIYHNRQTNKHTHTHTHIHTYKQTYEHTNTQTHKHTNKPALSTTPQRPRPGGGPRAGREGGASPRTRAHVAAPQEHEQMGQARAAHAGGDGAGMLGGVVGGGSVV